MQAQGMLEHPYDFFVFSNVGNDSENPATLQYLKEHTFPYAEANGITIIEISKTTRGVGDETLLEYLYRTPSGVPIPARMSNGSPGNRTCTQVFKIRLVDKWIRGAGFSHANVGLGISTDEFQRARAIRWEDAEDAKRKKRLGFWKRLEYPLLDLGINRIRCVELVDEAGLPRPPKSACWFCPYTSRAEWMERRRSNVTVTMPDGTEMQIFDAAVAVEKHLNEKRGRIGKDQVYLHPATKGSMQPLDIAVPNQPPLFPELFDEEDDNCDSGYCWT